MSTKLKKITSFEPEYKFQLEIMNIIHGIYSYTQEQDSLLLVILHGIWDESELHNYLLIDDQYSQGNLLNIMLFTSGRISYVEYKQLNPTKQPKLVFDDPNFDVIPFPVNSL